MVHLQISTEYLRKSCRTIGLAAGATKVSSRGQSTTGQQDNVTVQVHVSLVHRPHLHTNVTALVVSSPDTKFYERRVMLSHQSDCSGKVNCVCVIINSQLAIFLAPKQTLLVADNVFNTYNYPIYCPPYRCYRKFDRSEILSRRSYFLGNFIAARKFDRSWKISSAKAPSQVVLHVPSIT